MRRPSLLLVGILLLGAAWVCAQARRPPLPSEPISAVSDGNPVRNVWLIQIENNPCLSLRDIQRLAGGRVAWRRLSREVSLIRDGQTISFTLDASTAVVDGRPIPLDVPVRWWTGQAYIPLSFLLSSAFRSFAGADISWEPQLKILASTPIPAVSSPRFSSQTGRTRVIFDVAPRVDYRVLKQAEGLLLLRFFGGRSGVRERLEVQDPLINAVDILPRNRSTDVVFYFGGKAGPPRVLLEEEPRRVTVEVSRSDAPDPAVETPVPWNAPVLLPAPMTKAPEKTSPPTKNGAARKDPMTAALSPLRVIVVDPGHGGRDVGAVGRRGTLEKDINLLIAKEIARALREEGGYEVHLTRTTDDFVSLKDRADFANNVKADLFISVHCNAALTSRSNGFEVYFLSEKATDDASAAVARRENASLELEGPVDKVQAKAAQLLWSLAKTQDLNESSEVAALVEKHAQGTLEVTPRGVKQAGFYVLKWARMPAVLVESAFITNPKEEKLLRSSRYVDGIVKTVVSGVKDYERRKVQARLGKNGASGGT